MDDKIYFIKLTPNNRNIAVCKRIYDISEYESCLVGGGNYILNNNGFIALQEFDRGYEYIFNTRIMCDRFSYYTEDSIIQKFYRNLPQLEADERNIKIDNIIKDVVL